MAKEPLFKYPIVSQFLHYCGAIPIKRKQDQTTDQKLDNKDSLEHAMKVLENNECFGIFPEGVSHSDSFVHSLKSGIVRISLGALKNNKINEVFIVPTGLNYMNAGKFRSECVIHFGEPIRVTSNDDSYELLSRIENGLKKVAFHSIDTKSAELANTALQLYLPDQFWYNMKITDYVKAKKNFMRVHNVIIENNEAFADHHKKEYMNLYDTIEQYHDNLNSYGINDYIVKNKITKLHLISESFKIMFGSVLFLICGIINLPSFIITKLVVNTFISKTVTRQNGKFGQDMIATLKIFTMFSCTSVLYGTYGFVAWKYFNDYVTFNNLLLTFITWIGSSYTGIIGYEIIKKSHERIKTILNIPNKQIMSNLYEQRNGLPNRLRNVVKNVCDNYGEKLDIKPIIK